MRRRWWLLALVVLALAAAAAHVLRAAEPLVADLSSDEIAITTGFAGTDLLLFGALERPGDVVVVVRGPVRNELVRRRERIVGVWVNGASVTFRGLPAFYHVAATRPLSEFAPPSLLADRRIGADRLGFEAATTTPPSEARGFRDALVRIKTRLGLYGYEPAGVKVIGDRLFRTTVEFPANVPTGAYRVEVYLVNDGKLVGMRETPLVVRRVGLEADIFNFAHEQSAIYGLIAIVLALASGWIAGALFRR